MLYVNPCYMHCRCSNESRCLNYFEGLSNFFYNDSRDIMFDTSIDFKMPHIPAVNYMFKVNNRNTRTNCEICSKLTIKIPERRHWSRSDDVNFEHISHHVLLFLLLSLSR